MNYREVFKENYGDYPFNYEIHHIDHNRKNNNIKNLVALPKELHREYHKYHMHILNVLPFDEDKISTLFSMGNGEVSFKIYADLLNDVMTIYRVQQQEIYIRRCMNEA